MTLNYLPVLLYCVCFLFFLHTRQLNEAISSAVSAIAIGCTWARLPLCLACYTTMKMNTLAATRQ